MKKVMVEMKIVLKRLMKLALQMNNKDDFIYVIPSESLIKMYFKTCFVPIFDRFIWFGRVLQENLKKFGKHTFLENRILVLWILLYLKNDLF